MPAAKTAAKPATRRPPARAAAAAAPPARPAPSGVSASKYKEAEKRLTNLRANLKKAKEKSAEAAGVALGVAEVQVTAFGGGLAEGYFGRDKMKLGPVDIRAAGGTVLAGIGIVETLRGKKYASHLVNVGNGLLASWIVGAGIEAGKKLAEKRPAGGATSSTGGTRQITMDGIPPVDLQPERQRHRFVSASLD